MNDRRGRRDNGLDAALWHPLRDVDPRVGEHLLDVLREEGIAAYLAPSSDLGPYTRTQFLPSPPTDRLYVDRSRRAEARTVVDTWGDVGTPEAVRTEPAGRRRPDEHYEPPTPPPLPAPSPAALYAVLLIAAGLVCIFAPGVLRLSADLGIVLGVLAVVGGVGVLISRMRDHSDDGDDGAVV